MSSLLSSSQGGILLVPSRINHLPSLPFQPNLSLKKKNVLTTNYPVVQFWASNCWERYGGGPRTIGATHVSWWFRMFEIRRAPNEMHKQGSRKSFGSTWILSPCINPIGGIHMFCNMFFFRVQILSHCFSPFFDGAILHLQTRKKNKQTTLGPQNHETWWKMAILDPYGIWLL